MLEMGFEHTITVYELAKTVHGLRPLDYRDRPVYQNSTNIDQLAKTMNKTKSYENN
jgi:hypothetical protein